jgi:hypothetical protein
MVLSELFLRDNTTERDCFHFNNADWTVFPSLQKIFEMLESVLLFVGRHGQWIIPCINVMLLRNRRSGRHNEFRASRDKSDGCFRESCVAVEMWFVVETSWSRLLS